MTRRNFRFTYWLFSSISLVILVTSIVLTVRIGNDKRLPFFLADLNLYTEYFFLDSPECSLPELWSAVFLYLQRLSC